MIRGMTELALADANEAVSLQESIEKDGALGENNGEAKIQKDLLGLNFSDFDWKSTPKYVLDFADKTGLRAYALRSHIHKELGLEREVFRFATSIERFSSENLTKRSFEIGVQRFRGGQGPGW